MKSIEIIARVLIVNHKKILLCKGALHKDDHYFLPGGHVEFGESAETAIIREMNEEAHVMLSNIEYAGLVENKFTQNGELHHEINIIYLAELDNINVIAQEPHILFEWVDIQSLSDIYFLPAALAETIRTLTSKEKPFYMPLQ